MTGLCVYTVGTVSPGLPGTELGSAVADTVVRTPIANPGAGPREGHDAYGRVGRA